MGWGAPPCLLAARCSHLPLSRQRASALGSCLQVQYSRCFSDFLGPISPKRGREDPFTLIPPPHQEAAQSLSPNQKPAPCRPEGLKVWPLMACGAGLWTTP